MLFGCVMGSVRRTVTKISREIRAKSPQIFPTTGSSTWVPARRRSLRERDDILIFPIFVPAHAVLRGICRGAAAGARNTYLKPAYIESPQIAPNLPHITYVPPLFTPSDPVEGPAISLPQAGFIGDHTPDTERVAPRTNTALMWSCPKVQVDERRCTEGCSWLGGRGTRTSRRHRGQVQFGPGNDSLTPPPL